MLKKLTAMLLVILTVALSITTAFAATPVIEKVKYEGNGYVDVEFRRDVQYKSAKVTVKDSNGKSYTAKIVEKDDDELTFRVTGATAGKTYTFTISGVRSGRSGSYTKVKGTFKIPAASKVVLESVEYDREDRELDIEFVGKVSYKSLTVKVKNSAGKVYTSKIIDKDNDSIELRVAKLPKGTYKVVIKGVAPRGTSNYGKVTGSFRVY